MDDVNDCGQSIYITSSRIAFIEDPYAGQDLYWDAERYFDSYLQGEYNMNCGEVTSSWMYQSFGYPENRPWHGFPGEWFVDETINDTALGCDYWGDEYTGSVMLDN